MPFCIRKDFSDSEQFFQLFFLQAGADDAQSSRIFRRALSYIRLFRNHVEVDPVSVRSFHHSLARSTVP